MFKKSEEQEWSRFRGALAKDRDDAAAASTTSDASESTPATTAPGAMASSAAAGPSFRPSPGDVNVGLPSARLARSLSGDSSDVESLIGEHTHFEGTLKCQGAVRLLGSIMHAGYRNPSHPRCRRALTRMLLLGSAVRQGGAHEPVWSR